MAALPLVEAPADPMNTVRVWRRMRAAGFSLSAEGDDMVVTPASGLSEPQRAYIRQHKPELVALLKDADALHTSLVEAGSAGLGWREGTPPDWSADRLLAVGEVLYSENRMVNRNGRRYCPAIAPPIEIGQECHPTAKAPTSASYAPVARFPKRVAT